MQKYEVEITFIDGTTVVIEVEAENENDAYEKAMPIHYRVQNDF